MSLQYISKALNSMFDNGIFEESDLRTDYSSYGMYGRTCIGIVTDNTDLIIMNIIRCITYEILTDGKTDPDEVDYLLNDSIDYLAPSTDSMGRQAIIYFPNMNKDDLDLSFIKSDYEYESDEEE